MLVAVAMVVSVGIVLSLRAHASAAPVTQSTAAPVTQQAHAQVPTPTGIELPTLGVKSSLIATGLNPDSSIEVPSVLTPEQASYYRFGPVPGMVGPAVVLGHVNGNGKQGVFARLSQLKPGDQVLIDQPSGPPLQFVVYNSKSVGKDVFPWGDVLAHTNGPELRLITCTGALDRTHHSYLSNLIVYARKA